MKSYIYGWSAYFGLFLACVAGGIVVARVVLAAKPPFSRLCREKTSAEVARVVLAAKAREDERRLAYFSLKFRAAVVKLPMNKLVKCLIKFDYDLRCDDN